MNREPMSNRPGLATLLGHPRARLAAREVSDWIDLQWSLLVEQLRAVAPQASGRLLDVGCGNKPYEHFFRPFVSEYIGVEHEATFSETSASLPRFIGLASPSSGRAPGS